ncbi:MAG: carboxypeptidase-like regulatory domain-containing protein, partial [Bacteroidales bacterium]
RFISIVVIGIVLMVSNNLFAIGDNTGAPNTKSNISGKVIDNKTGESLVGVAISVEGTDIKTYSDLDGNFEISSLTPGNYNLILSLISYKNSLVENLKISANEKEVIDIKLDAIR